MLCPFRKVQPHYCNGEDSTRVEGFAECYKEKCMAYRDPDNWDKDNPMRGVSPLKTQPYCELMKKGVNPNGV